MDSDLYVSYLLYDKLNQQKLFRTNLEITLDRNWIVMMTMKYIQLEMKMMMNKKMMRWSRFKYNNQITNVY